MAVIVTRAGKGAPLSTAEVDANFTGLNAELSTLARAIAVQMTASTTVGGIQQLSAGDLNMGTNDFTLEFDEVIPTTRPAAAIVLDRKHDGTNGYILSLLTTGIVRLQINGFTYDSTVALPSATNVNPKLYIPVIRETASAAGSVTFYSNGVILGTAVAIAAHGDLTTELVTNGTFDTDLTDWTLATSSGGTIAWNSGKMRVDRTSATTSGYQEISVVANNTYLISVDATFVSGSNAANAAIRTTAVANSTILKSATITAGTSGTISFFYTAASTGSVFLHLGLVSSGTYDFDNVSLKRTVTINNTAPRIINGTTTTRTAGSLQASRMYNRALDAPTVLDYTNNGPALADRGASQTPVYTSDFSAGVDGFSAFNGPALSVSGGELILTPGATNNSGASRGGTLPSNPSKTIINFTARCESGTKVIGVGGSTSERGSPGNQVTLTTIDQNFVVAYTPSGASFATLALGTVDTVDAGRIFIKNITATKTGLTSELIASNAQSNTGQIIDTSGNRNHALLPASGATIVGANPARSRQVRSRHQWTATSELQYLAGVNQAVLPPNAAIEYIDIFSDASLDVNIGNGTTATQYASAASLVAGWNRVTLANFYAGTTVATRKLTVTPTSSATAVLDFVVTYHAAETE